MHTQHKTMINHNHPQLHPDETSSSTSISRTILFERESSSVEYGLYGFVWRRIRWDSDEQTVRDIPTGWLVAEREF